ncbi:MAG: hypothetical protein ACOWWO_07300 [Peptococcaceae bacterium]
MRCEKLAGCPFYQEKMPMESGLGAMYRKKYCETDKTNCARYLIATTLGPQCVPVDLYPNMSQRAEQIIAEKTKP